MIPAANHTLIADFAADVRRDLALQPKQLQSKYLYNALGSSLFEAICRLPWYGITRAETRLLGRHGGEIVEALGESEGATIVELGCGSGEKLMLLAAALQARGRSAHVHLIDISSQALEQTEQRLNGLQHFSVASAFNKNLLVRINQELGGDFDLRAFRHRAVWNSAHQRIEMHLVSRAFQTVHIAAANATVTFARDESIWTESSYKYLPDQIVGMGADAGFATRDQWIDADARFALTLMTAM
jgi:uncharacterized SAM-dependent methyltransferase